MHKHTFACNILGGAGGGIRDATSRTTRVPGSTDYLLLIDLVK